MLSFTLKGIIGIQDAEAKEFATKLSTLINEFLGDEGGKQEFTARMTNVSNSVMSCKEFVVIARATTKPGFKPSIDLEPTMVELMKKTIADYRSKKPGVLFVHIDMIEFNGESYANNHVLPFTACTNVEVMTANPFDGTPIESITLGEFAQLVWEHNINKYITN
jgi:hypothetical protein